ncbi:hypothetical protein PPL_08055 [Heterostelium album PN500]|uniref:EGF-like domain-containing protein n=1 Tax=Heterostelium pallidum (strain ATCC 26659 / Pp 5 / PN500) TaxID=670386 RepID=D3BIH6_HETP5|nr:hypothetical protein PPL_08055 [Heterostelium album PN500]EFA78600.1 hypothetical protein PPL_08055 [Heterostelium album PN500]|eukprot:XP_020430724.1 hypothetical protein PPL_08055 [Heterostelium album PN500]
MLEISNCNNHSHIYRCILFLFLFVLSVNSLSTCKYSYFDFSSIANKTFSYQGVSFQGASATYYWTVCGTSALCNSNTNNNDISACQNVTSGFLNTGEEPGAWSSNGTSLAVFFNATRGAACYNKLKRTTTVHLTCGLGETSIINAYEPASPYCQYQMEMYSPMACRLPQISSLQIAQYPKGAAYLSLQIGEIEKKPTYTVSVAGIECTNSLVANQLYTCELTSLRLENGGNYSIRIFSKSATGIPETTFPINNYILKYPIVSAVNSLTVNGGNLTLGGYFGTNLNLPSVVLNGSVECQILEISSTTIICRLNSTQLQPGRASLNVTVDGYPFTSHSLISVVSNDYSKCEREGCSGNGKCNEITGTCDCDNNYYGPKCNLKPGDGEGGVFKPNKTKPSIDIEYNGYVFRFSIFSIQEIRGDGSIEFEVTPDQWNHTIDNSTALTTIDYDMLPSNSSAQKQLQVKTRISFSSLARTFTFGSKSYNLPPNAVKVGVNVSNWVYSSNLNYLRVVFITAYNPSQKIGCGGEINAFNKDDQSSIQSLMIVKDDVIYYGRFLDYSISDGRETYSSNELISVDEEAKTALIGINLPQCNVCELDPDFSSLVSTDNNSCSKVEFEVWKIALICGLVGGTLLIGLGIIFYSKRKYFYLRYLSLTAKKDPNVNLTNLNSSQSTVKVV